MPHYDTLRIPWIPACLVAYCSAFGGTLQAQFANEERVASLSNFFEANIRPALVEHCLECHSAATEASGGLLLDSKLGWEAGGDSGPAILPGQPEKSRLMRAIRYDDPDLQMPPDGKLPQSIVESFEHWISEGAFDPRSTARPPAKPRTGMPVEQAQEHWAYREISIRSLPHAGELADASEIDFFINRKLAEAGLEATSRASQATIVRRLYFDLTGLPPPPLELILGANGKANADPGSPGAVAYERLVDRLLDSPQFGENFARKWMDVARYAESITLRGFVLPEAWRYRDYLIEAFAEDRPFDQMIREQVAGDLLQHNDLRERRMQLVATGFLAIGNTNLEKQDKTQLEMDYIDEQIEVIGSAFLAQTIGCARCHDHKFDPIPTRDYYAMAGILHSAVALEHANLSKWIEQPLPVPEDEEKRYDGLAQRQLAVKNRIAELKKLAGQEAGYEKRMIPVEELPGIVVDSLDAKLVGNWRVSTFGGRAIGNGFIHDENAQKGMKTATFEPEKLPPGEYEVRLAYVAGDNRASNAIVRVFSADGEATVFVNQRQLPSDDRLWVSLGQYRFEKDGQAFVLVTNEMSDGHVIADAVQFLPVDSRTGNSNDSDNSAKSVASDGSRKSQQEVSADADRELKLMEEQGKKLEKQLNSRPKYLTLVEKPSPADIPIHIRGDVHSLGDVVPRGFLTAIHIGREVEIAPDSSGRLELAHWLSSDRNPLTARVYANRVWCWLMGQGLVSSVNNFGTTGTPPTHPDLLDWLARELIRSGWSTKHLVRLIVHSEAYRRRVCDPDELQSQVDPSNTLYWRGHSRRLSAEAIRDTMLSISGELDETIGGSLIRSNTNADYNYRHESTRRSLYHPVFRNSLPELFEAFDFADTSMSIGQRPRSTVATQALVLLNHPWVAARAEAAAKRLQLSYGDSDINRLLSGVYVECFGRLPTAEEIALCREFLQRNDGPSDDADRFQILVHSMFAALDFRYLD